MPIGEDKRRLNITVDVKTHTKLKAIGRRTGLPVATVAAIIVENHAGEEAAFVKLLEVAGAFKIARYLRGAGEAKKKSETPQPAKG